ncbi:hypothetical protein B0H14DRAFT_3162131 [Mycena olivaceomarginata]|nr:hypothetical protein B0H14DRAFT_3162131 [Mycena olivaceomarginata]
MVCPPFCHQELQAHHPEFDGKLRTTSIGDIYEAVRASQETVVCNEMRETHPCQPFTGARSLVLTCARPFDLLLGIEASCNTTVMLEGGVMAKQNKKQERLKGAPTRENPQEFDGKVLVNSVDHLSGASFKLPHLQSYAPQALASDSLPPPQASASTFFLYTCFPAQILSHSNPHLLQVYSLQASVKLPSTLYGSSVFGRLIVLSGDMLHALEECAWSSSLWLLVLDLHILPA